MKIFVNEGRNKIFNISFINKILEKTNLLFLYNKKNDMIFKRALNLKFDSFFYFFLFLLF